jgi:hypothetical protein
MKVATLVLALGKRFSIFGLNSNLTFPYIVELGEGTTDIGDYLLPWFGVEAGVTLRDLSDDYPGVEL